jgi:hypothetical protein
MGINWACEREHVGSGISVAREACEGNLVSSARIHRGGLIVKQYQGTGANERKPQGSAPAQQNEPETEKEKNIRKGEGQKKVRPVNLANPARQGK